MKFLVLTKDDVKYADDNWQAAALVKPQWDTRQLALRLSTLSPGDELEIDADTSIIALSGTEMEFKS